MSLRPASRFDEVYRTGSRARHGSVTVVEAEGRGSLPEVGVVAGRRVGNAVRRNRAKRRLREAAARVTLRPGRAYVLIASPEVPELPFTRLVADVSAATSGAHRDAGTRDAGS